MPHEQESGKKKKEPELQVANNYLWIRLASSSYILRFYKSRSGLFIYILFWLTQLNQHFGFFLTYLNWHFFFLSACCFQRPLFMEIWGYCFVAGCSDYILLLLRLLKFIASPITEIVTAAHTSVMKEESIKRFYWLTVTKKATWAIHWIDFPPGQNSKPWVWHVAYQAKQDLLSHYSPQFKILFRGKLLQIYW